MKIIDKIQEFYWSVIPYEYRLGELWYKFKCFVWHRYSTVKSRHLGHTWVDRSDLMHYTMMEILSDFIEKECGEDCIVDWDSDDEHRRVRSELQEIYDWWHQDYLKNHDHYYDEWHDFSKKYSSGDILDPVWVSKQTKAHADHLFNQALQREKDHKEELNRRLHQLVDLAPYMWT